MSMLRIAIASLLLAALTGCTAAKSANGPESVGAVPLVETQRFPQKHQSALAAVVAELNKNGDVPSDYSATVEESERGVEFHLWHKTAFLPENQGAIGNPGGRCLTIVYKNGRIISKGLWQ